MRLRPFLPFATDLAAAAAGLLLALAFPRPDLAPLAWFALVPLLLVMHRHPFRSGFVAGVAFFALVLYWLNVVMVTFGGLPLVLSLVAYLLLVAYLALFFAAATWGACRLREKAKLAVVLTLPILWVGLEFLRGWLFTGFPWALLGYSQQSSLTLLQSADLCGVYGLSFLLILVNAALAALVQRLRGGNGPWPWRGAVAALLLVAAAWSYGSWRLGTDLDRRDKTLQTTLVQGNIDQSVKWDPAFQRSTVEIYRNLSLAATPAPELLVWPESATPFYYQSGGLLADEVRDVARQRQAFLLFGSPAYERSNLRDRYLNSAFLLAPAGEILGRSDKVHLVPFGEYVPLSTFLPFVNKLVAGIGDFSPGTVSPLPLDGHRLGVLVCYEAIFPELARDYVQKGSELLVNVTNDAWYGHTSAPYQHLAMARFRAVENRIWLARAANTGISAFVAPSGRILGATDIFTTTSSSASVGLGARPTLYGRIGDSLPLFCLGLGIIWLVRTREHFARG